MGGIIKTCFMHYVKHLAFRPVSKYLFCLPNMVFVKIGNKIYTGNTLEFLAKISLADPEMPGNYNKNYILVVIDTYVIKY
jgi:hypothetical protein